MNRLFALLDMLAPRGAHLFKRSVVGLWLPALLPVLAAPHLAMEGHSEAGKVQRAQVGLRVHPPVMLIRDVAPGMEVVLPVPITVENSGAGAVSFTISPIAPSSIGIRTMRGYTDIPEPTWCAPGERSLTLGPGESRSVPVSVFVPAEECCENRSWCAVVSVQTEGTGTLGAAAYPYIYIETKNIQRPSRPSSEADGARALPEDSPRRTGIPEAEESGAGCLRIEVQPQRAGESPQGAVLDAGDVPAGKTGFAGGVTVENRYAEDVFVEMRSLLPEPKGLAGSVLLTPGHTWIEDEGWLHIRRQGLLLLAGKKAVFQIDAASPSSPSTYNYRWEGFVEVVGPRGPEAVVRIRWRTTSPPAVARSPGGGD